MAKYSLAMTPTPCRVDGCIISIRNSCTCLLAYLLTYSHSTVRIVLYSGFARFALLLHASCFYRLDAPFCHRQPTCESTDGCIFVDMLTLHSRQPVGRYNLKILYMRMSRCIRSTTRVPLYVMSSLRMLAVAVIMVRTAQCCPLRAFLLTELALLNGFNL